ncbi:MAG: DUF533 domain-containing protein [Roseobacter sp.]
MSLMNTVTKMALGFAVAKGMQAVNQRGGIGAVMQDLQGAATSQAGGMGGLGDILGQLSGGAGGTGASGGLGDLLGQLTGGAGATTASAGGLTGLDGLLGGLAGARGGAAASDLEALLEQDNPTQEPDEDEMAQLMLRATLYAARADGDIDPDEKAKLMDAMRDADPEDLKAVQKVLSEEPDPTAIADATPKGLETQVYTMSLNAITPDNRAEAEFLHTLAQRFGLSPSTVNALHDSLAVPRIYQ